MSAEKTDAWDPHVGARVPREMKQEILNLTSYLGGVENANLSVVVRELFRLSLSMITPAFVARATRLARHYSWDRAVVWTEIVEAGLSALEARLPHEQEEVSRGE